jgi:8-oxo-dGTP diphosphatase
MSPRRPGLTGRHPSAASSWVSFRRLVGRALRLPPGRFVVRLILRLTVARHRVGVAAVIRDERGQVLLLEHTVRAGCAWGLPGGWLARGEDPADGLRREVREELGLALGEMQVVVCEKSPPAPGTLSPPSLSIIFAACAPVPGSRVAVRSAEIISAGWFDPAELPRGLLPLHVAAIARSHYRGTVPMSR